MPAPNSDHLLNERKKPRASSSPLATKQTSQNSSHKRPRGLVGGAARRAFHQLADDARFLRALVGECLGRASFGLPLGGFRPELRKSGVRFRSCHLFFERGTGRRDGCNRYRRGDCRRRPSCRSCASCGDRIVRCAACGSRSGRDRRHGGSRLATQDFKGALPIHGLLVFPKHDAAFDQNATFFFRERCKIAHRRRDERPLDHPGCSFCIEKRNERLADSEFPDGSLDVDSWIWPKGIRRCFHRLLITRRKSAEGVLEAIPELSQDLVRDVERVLRDEKHTHPLASNEPNDLFDLVLHRLRQVVEKQMCFIEEENELRLVHVTDFRKALEKFAEHPEHECGVRARRAHERGGVQDTDDAAAIFGDLHEICEIESWLTEKAGSPFPLHCEKAALDRADGCGGNVAILRRNIPGVLCNVLEHRLQIFEIEEEKPLLISDVENDIEHTFLRFIQPEQPRDEQRPHLGDRRTHGMPSLSEYVPEHHRESVRRDFETKFLGPLDHSRLIRPRFREPAEVALHVGEKYRDADRGEILRQHTKRDRLARTRRPGDQPVAIGHLREEIHFGGTLRNKEWIDGHDHESDMGRRGCQAGEWPVMKCVRGHHSAFPFFPRSRSARQHMPAIQTKGLTKVFRIYKKKPGLAGAVRGLFHRVYEDVRAADDITFSIEEGECVGFLGPNGAGKTTVLKMLSGLLYPTAGEARVLGHVPWHREDALKRQFALLMGQKNALWWDLPARESLELNRAIYEIDERRFRDTVEELTLLLEVKDKLDTMVRELSLGERMKFELISALLHSPRVLFLDEPTIGLDVTSQLRVRDFLRDYNNEARITTLLTSHYMADIEALCARVIIIDHGKIFYDGPLSGIVERFSAHKIVGLCFKGVTTRDLSVYGEVTEKTPQSVRLKVPRPRVAEVCREILGQFEVMDFSVQEPPIEDVIRQLFADGKVEG